MDKLIVVKNLDSREVADMIGKRHDNLIRDIRSYIEGLVGDLKVEVSDYYLESSYQSEQNKEKPCYKVTRKGCELIANKMTGKKGIAFSIAYIEKFHEMEEELKQPQKELSRLEILQIALEAEVKVQQLQLEKQQQQILLEEKTEKIQTLEQSNNCLEDKVSKADQFIKPGDGEYSLQYLAEHFGVYTNKDKLHTEFIAAIVNETCWLKNNTDNDYYRSGLSIQIKHKTNIVIKEAFLELLNDFIFDENNVVSSKFVKGKEEFTYSLSRRKHKCKVYFNK